MPNRLASALSPYLRSHADNPVHWNEWGPAPFAEAAERGVPLLVSIGYSTCHWCHVMARESFSDPQIAEALNAGFVAIKVDREEHPDVDATYLAAAGAFTEQLGWPLNVFVTPEGRAFYAGTYWPPRQMPGHPSFGQVLAAVTDAWANRREAAESTAAAIAEALGAASTAEPAALPTEDSFGRMIAELVGYEDTQFGGFGGAPKFPVATVLNLLLDRGTLVGTAGSSDAAALARRVLAAMAASPLRDDVEGGFFRYSTRRDWSDPHYERMLYDNAQLLTAYARVGDVHTAGGIADFLGTVMRLPGGAFASAQDSESTVDGQRVEGGYYALDADGRAKQSPPALDSKVLAGWNGLAIEALASAGARLERPEWVTLARDAAHFVLANQRRDDGTLVRASVDGRMSQATATLEDYGMLAGGLLALALATGEVEFARTARELVDLCIADDAFRVPGGGDPVLLSQGLAITADPSEGAYPSGVSALARAAVTLHQLTADDRYRQAATAAMAAIAPLVEARPIAFGAALGVMSAVQQPSVQLVVVTDAAAATVDMDGVAAEFEELARGWERSGALVAVVTDAQAVAFADAGFELFEARTSIHGAAAYLCFDFVCRLPVTDPDALELALDGVAGGERS